jgi:hypothetical protein
VSTAPARLAPEYVPPSQTASLNSLLGAVVDTENAVRSLRYSEDQVAALTADLAAQQRRLPLKPSLMERGWVEQRAHNLNIARRDLAIARRTLEGSRKSLAQTLAAPPRLSFGQLRGSTEAIVGITVAVSRYLTLSTAAFTRCARQDMSAHRRIPAPRLGGRSKPAIGGQLKTGHRV